MGTSNYQEIATRLAPFLNALSHPARVQILIHLAKHKECPAGNISARLPLAKSTVSEHLNKLKDAELVTCVSKGSCINYRINKRSIDLVRSFFNDFLTKIEHSQNNQSICCLVDNDKVKENKCSRIYDICKTLPCFTDDCFSKNQ